MKSKDFRAWIVRMGYNDSEAARKLGLGSRNTITKYKDEGAPEYIGLACAALAYGLPAWEKPPWTKADAMAKSKTS